MATPGFYSQNRNRAYPFRTGTAGLKTPGPLTLGRAGNGLVVDAGFVLGPESGYDPASHEVRLHAVRRSGTRFDLEFACDAPGTYAVPLTFSRYAGGPDEYGDFSDTGDAGLSANSLSVSGSGTSEVCDEPLWSGFVVTGDMSLFELLLPADGAVYAGDGECLLEQALLQNLSGAFVVRLGVANDDRTRTDPSDGCDGPDSPFPAGLVHVYDPCVSGRVVFRPGYNANVRLSEDAVVLGAAVGDGEGEPCGQVPRFRGESPPEGSGLLEGGPTCDETLRSVNGVGGRLFAVLAGPGVTVTAKPDEHEVEIDVDLSGLAINDQVSAVSDSC